MPLTVAERSPATRPAERPALPLPTRLALSRRVFHFWRRLAWSNPAGRNTASVRRFRRRVATYPRKFSASGF